MKIFGGIGVVLWVVGICPAPHQAAAAGKYDGSVPFVCVPFVYVPLSVTECGAEGECQKGAPQSVNLPLFFRLDFTTMTLRALEENRQSAIKDVSQMVIQPFVNYNLPDGWYLSSVPLITANWEASSGNTWTVPVGGGGGGSCSKWTSCR
jgi:hypothetical protein